MACAVAPYLSNVVPAVTGGRGVIGLSGVRNHPVVAVLSSGSPRTRDGPGLFATFAVYVTVYSLGVGYARRSPTVHPTRVAVPTGVDGMLAPVTGHGVPDGTSRHW